MQFGDGVESIGARAFYGCSSLAEIVLPRKLTAVENYAFFGCASLRSVTLQTGITQIKIHAFEGCAALEIIYFPGSRDEWLGISKAADWDKDAGDYTVRCTDGDIHTYSDGLVYKDAEGGSAWRVTDIGTFAGEALIIPAFYEGRPVVEISRQAFAGCEDLTSVTIPKSVKVIDDSAFEDCGAIKKVYYKGELSDWYAISFGGAESNPLHSGADLFVNGAAVTMLIVPKAVEAIGDGQFAGCATIEEVNMGSGVTRIGSEAFGGCKNITAVSLSSSTLLEEIDDYAFEGCEKLVRLIIPNSVTKLGRYLCKGCESLYQATLGTGVTAIPASAFEGCMSLKTVRINGKITSIGAKAFAGCVSLETVIFSGTKAEWEALQKGSGWASATPNFAVTCSDGTVYPNS